LTRKTTQRRLEQGFVTSMDQAAKSRSCNAANAANGTPSGTPIDLDHLRRYTLGDAHLEQEILGLFIDQAPVTLDALKRASTSKGWVMAAHTLKGSARAVGAWRLAKLAEEAEQLGGPTDRTACDEVLRNLDEAAAEARAHIAALPPPA
jgi:HPt (histidine-containing phosphotransfer) domain-containing protein